MELKEIGVESIKDIVALWNKNIGALYPMDEKLFRQNYLNEKNRKKIAGAFIDRKLVGFIIYKQQTEDWGLNKPDMTMGYINSVIVDMKYRRKGIASNLFDIAEGELKSWGVKTIKFGQDTMHFFPGVPSEFKIFERFLSNRGYIIGSSHVDLICDISNVELEKLPDLKLNNDPKYSYELLRKEDFDELMRFLKDCFSGRWYGDKKTFFNLGMEEKDIVVVKNGHNIIGFAHIYDNKSVFIGPPIYWRELLGENYGGLGPIGIDSNYRKQGLGLTLLYKSLEILKDRGVKKMVIDWTELIDFYGLFNFMPWKEYKTAFKSLNK